MAEGKKFDAGKLRFDLLPVEPLRKVAEVYTIGAKKYDDRNWEKGLQWGRVFAAMQRHAWSWWNREQKDAVDGQHHLASVVWCALALMEYEQTHPELDDRVERKEGVNEDGPELVRPAVPRTDDGERSEVQHARANSGAQNTAIRNETKDILPLLNDRFDWDKNFGSRG